MKTQQKFNVVKMIFGSKLYGTATNNSDTDYQAVYKPDIKSVILNNYTPAYKINTNNSGAKNSKDDVDINVTSLQRFLKHAIQGETFALDMLHSHKWEYASDEWIFLRENRSKFYTKNMKAFLGYVKNQAAKYGIKGSRLKQVEDALLLISKSSEFSSDKNKSLLDLFGENTLLTSKYPFKFDKKDEHGVIYVDVIGKKYNANASVNYMVDSLGKFLQSYGHRAKLAKENKGVDWKALHHALRCGYQLRSIYEHGDFSYPLGETDFLMKVKNGELDYQDIVAPELENVVEEVEELAALSDYPDKVNQEFWDNWMVNLYVK